MNSNVYFQYRQGSVYEAPVKTRNPDLERIFTAEAELYREKANNPKDAEVVIFVAIK